MNPKSVGFLLEAAEEAHAATAWYVRRSPHAAERFFAELERAVQMVAEAPGRWPIFEEGTRRYPPRRFPYWLIYRVKADSVQIVAVAHARRRPGYWRQRLG